MSIAESALEGLPHWNAPEFAEALAIWEFPPQLEFDAIRFSLPSKS